MKKILLFTAAMVTLWACEPEVEVEYVKYNNLPSNQDPDPDPGNDTGGHDPVPNQDIKLVIDEDGVLYNPDLGYLNFVNAYIEVNEGQEPTHIAVRLFENGRELNPAGYWHFEKYEDNPWIWYRPVHMELMPNEIQGNSIGVQVFVKYADSVSFILVAWDDEVKIQRP